MQKSHIQATNLLPFVIQDELAILGAECAEIAHLHIMPVTDFS